MIQVSHNLGFDLHEKTVIFNAGFSEVNILWKLILEFIMTLYITEIYRNKLILFTGTSNNLLKRP